MYGLFDLLDKVKQYFRFSKEEIKSIIIATLILGFVVGFDDGSETFELMYWLKNLFNSILVVALAILVRESAIRIYALHSGHRAELKLWWLGLGGALIMAIISFGKLPLLLYGGILVHFIPRHRIGYFRYGHSYGDMGMIALWGSIANVVLALIFKMFMFLPNPLIRQAMVINIAMACFNMLPIPPLAGSMVLFASRAIYGISVGAILAGSFLMLFSTVKIAIIGTLIIAPLFGLAFNKYFEQMSGGDY